MDLEIEEQPEVLRGLLAQQGDVVAEVAAAIRAYKPAHVVIAARGSSDNAARYAQYVLGAHHRYSVGLAVPSLHTIYRQPPSLRGALTIGISQSGQSPDVVAVVDNARYQGGLTLAITNEPDSPLARAAEHRIGLCTGKERAVAATKTYTAQLMAVAMLSAALDKSGALAEEVAQVPDWVADAVKRSATVGNHVADYRESTRFVVLGRGFNYCTAFELALKIKETSHAMADPYSVADLLHGPVAMLEPGLPAIVIAPRGPATRALGSLLTVLASRGADALVLSDDPEVGALGRHWVSLPPEIPPWLSPISAIVPGQRFSAALAEAKGRDPARPRGLSKVTLTL